MIKDIAYEALHVLDHARTRADGALLVLGEALYDRKAVMAGDEVNAMRARVQRGIVHEAWSRRVAWIAEEVGDG